MYQIIQVLIWPDSVNEALVKYVEDNKIDPRRIEIVDQDMIIIRNEE